MVWFIDNNAAACTAVSSGCGRLSHPFSTLASFNTANGAADVPASHIFNPAANDNIFVYESATGYSGAVTLLTGQKLIGQDATATLATITGLTPPTGSASFPAMNSGNGTVTNITSTVTLNANTTARGLSINSTTNTGMNDPAGAITGVNVSEVNVATTTGTAVSLSDVGGTVSFTSIPATGATTGISVTNNTGSFTVTGTGTTAGSGGTIQNCTQRGAKFSSANNITLKYMNFTGNGTANLDAAVTCGDNKNGTNTNCAAGIDLQTVTTVSMTGVHVSGGAQIGINGNGVTAMTLTSVEVNNAGNEANESGIQIHGLFGTTN